VNVKRLLALCIALVAAMRIARADGNMDICYAYAWCDATCHTQFVCDSPSDQILAVGGHLFRVQVISPYCVGDVADFVKLSENSGYAWMFTPDNPEIIVAIVDGGDHLWVKWGGPCGVTYWVVVTDVVTRQRREYFNPAGGTSAQIDTRAFEK